MNSHEAIREWKKTGKKPKGLKQVPLEKAFPNQAKSEALSKKVEGKKFSKYQQDKSGQNMSQ